MRFVPKMSRFGLEVFQDKLRDDEGYVDLLRTMDTPTGDRPAYLSVSLIRQAAARIPQLGLVPRAELELAKQHLADTEDLLAQANARLDQLEFDLASYRDGFQRVIGKQPPRRQGRPPTRKVAA